MSTETHEHTLAWAFEGPLWFCECGAEFYPKKAPAKTKTVDPHPTRARMRIRLKATNEH